jgi:hypothetical protein
MRRVACAIVGVVNIARAFEELKALVVCRLASMTTGTSRRLTGIRRAPWSFAPMAGHVKGLNVRVAADVVMFKSRRQRREA